MKKYWLKNIDLGQATLLYSRCDTLLDESEKTKILDDLNEGLPRYDVLQYFNAQPTIFSDYTHLVISKDNATGKTVGLLGAKSFEAEGFKFLYFWTAMLAASHHRTKLLSYMYACLLDHAVTYDGFYNFLATKTYNPIVYYLFQKNKQLLGEQVGLYPHVDGENDPEMMDYARKIAKVICPTLTVDEQSGCVHGGQAVLAPNFFPELPYCSDEKIYEHFKKSLTPKDQILCVIKIPSQLEDDFYTKILRKEKNIS
jgi:hypothetical protein